jgi:hypothetical protein
MSKSFVARAKFAAAASAAFLLFYIFQWPLSTRALMQIRRTSVSTSPSPAPDTGIEADLHGARPFPATNAWNQDVSHLPVHPNSANLISSIGSSVGLHPDFGTFWEGSPIGIPYVVVSGSQQKVPVNFTDSADESDAGPYPIPPDAPIEGGSGSDGDRHVLVVDRDNWNLYETYYSFPLNGATSWNAASGAVWDLNSNALRPPGWTSADAAGLPIFPGLVRRDEVIAGEIRHAVRFTASTTRSSYIYPATHQTGSTSSVNAPPMGMRVRLKANYNISSFSPNVQVILRALKKYGMILADNGSNWYISGTHDPLWNDDELSALSRVKGSDFEVVETPNHPLTPVSDFDSDGITDLSVYRPSDGRWYVVPSGGGVTVDAWGTTGDIPIPGDFDGDGHVDPAVYRPSTGEWLILQSSDSSVRSVSWGTSTDKPLPFDFDGDGKSDIAVFRPGNGQWFIMKSKTAGFEITAWGTATDIPVPADYDGDSSTDIAVYRPSNGTWFIIRSSGGGYSSAWGAAADKPVPADYDGDGKDDLAVFRPSEGNWYILKSSNLQGDAVNWGIASDVPVPGDYDGDGRDDIGVYRAGTWYCIRSTAGALVANWGSAGDVPIAARYIP